MTLAGLGWLPWRAALVVTAIALVAMTAPWLFPRTRSKSRILGEVALILGLYAVWQVIAALSKAGLVALFVIVSVILLGAAAVVTLAFPSQRPERPSDSEDRTQRHLA